MLRLHSPTTNLKRGPMKNRDSVHYVFVENKSFSQDSNPGQKAHVYAPEPFGQWGVAKAAEIR